jgi:hypothetical protein
MEIVVVFNKSSPADPLKKLLETNLFKTLPDRRYSFFASTLFQSLLTLIDPAQFGYSHTAGRKVGSKNWMYVVDRLHVRSQKEASSVSAMQWLALHGLRAPSSGLNRLGDLYFRSIPIRSSRPLSCAGAMVDLAALSCTPRKGSMSKV